MDLMSFEFISGFVICWGFSFSFFLMLKIKLDEPNNPERRGRRGWFRGIRRVIIPRKPANAKITTEVSLFLLFTSM